MVPHPHPTPGSVTLPDPAELEMAREQVERILASNTLRGSEVLRRLFRFLAEKTFSGEADQLKEYSIGLDALGKPANYDTRQDASVRLQASRLRQKLEEYHRTEGRSDPLIIELPRGRFKIAWREGAPAAAPVEAAEKAVEQKPPSGVIAWRGLAIGLAVVSLVFGCLSTWAILRLSRVLAANPRVSAAPAPELDELWRPFIASANHLIIASSDPMFVQLRREGKPDIFYRQRDAEGWEESTRSPEFAALSRALGRATAKPTYDYAPRGEMIAAFVLDQFLAPHRADVSMIRVGQLSWQQFADNDVIFLAPRAVVAEKIAALPIRPAFMADQSGIRNLHPRPGEPAVYEDAEFNPESSGETLELVSLMPGPLGRTTVASFTGGRAWGVIGAIRSLMDPAIVRIMIQHVKGSSKEMPISWQLVIRIRYRDGTPTNASYVTHRVLTSTRN